MRKLLLLILGITIALPAFTQVDPDFYTGTKLQKIQITVVDGLIYKWTAVNQKDTVRHFNIQEGKKYLATITFQEIGANTIEAESTTTYSGMTPGGEPGVTCCIQANSYAAYPVSFTSGKTKLTVRYTRGSAGNGTLTLRNGSQTGTPIEVTGSDGVKRTTMTFPSTGSWQTFGTAVFYIPSQIGTKVLYFTSSETGPCNPDKFTFE